MSYSPGAALLRIAYWTIVGWRNSNIAVAQGLAIVAKSLREGETRMDKAVETRGLDHKKAAWTWTGAFKMKTAVPSYGRHVRG